MRGKNGSRWWPRILSYTGYSPVSDQHKLITVGYVLFGEHVKSCVNFSPPLNIKKHFLYVCYDFQKDVENILPEEPKKSSK